MCGRYTLVKTGEIERRFGVQQESFSLEARYNIAPSQQLPIVLKNSPAHLELMRWGLVPFWAKDVSIGYKMINARAEGIAQKPAFRQPFRQQRCIVPASGFYEWQKLGSRKIPYYFRLKETELFGFAGLYDTYTDENGQKLRTYTIITTAANELVGEVHDRMPVILRPEDEESWLNPDLHDPEILLALLKTYPAELMETYAVSSEVNKPQNEGPQLLERVA